MAKDSVEDGQKARYARHGPVGTWTEYKDSQKEIELPANTVAHVPVTIRYVDIGQAQKGTILLMHDIPTWGFLYHAVIPLIIDAGYRVIVPDFLGYGFSDRRDCFDRSFQDQAKVICTLLPLLGLSQVHMVGHDIGGAVALIMAIEHPQFVGRLVISNSVCYDRFDDDMLDFGHPLRWKSRSISELVKALEESLVMGLSRAEQLTEVFREGMIAPWKTEEGKLSLLRNASALNANQSMALVDRHGAILSPTLVLWGVDDPWQKIEDGKRLASEIPKGKFQPIENASHWIPQDAPEEFVSAVLEFLTT